MASGRVEVIEVRRVARYQLTTAAQTREPLARTSGASVSQNASVISRFALVDARLELHETSADADVRVAVEVVAHVIRWEATSTSTRAIRRPST